MFKGVHELTIDEEALRDGKTPSGASTRTQRTPAIKETRAWYQEGTERTYFERRGWSSPSMQSGVP